MQRTADQIKYSVALNFGSVVYASFATKALRSFLVCASQMTQFRAVKSQHHRDAVLGDTTLNQDF